MSLLQTFQQWDAAAFRFVNGSLSNPLFDAMLPFFREKWFWAPAYLFVVAFTWINFRRKRWVIVLGLIAAVGLSDFTSSTLVKKNAQRLRPCNDPAMIANVVLRTGSCGSGYSFTSSHAANHFAVAVFLIGMFGGLARWVRPASLVWATSIALAQVYVGVHYPGDVLCGALLGMAIGWWVVLTIRKLDKERSL